MRIHVQCSYHTANRKTNCPQKMFMKRSYILCLPSTLQILQVSMQTVRRRIKCSYYLHQYKISTILVFFFFRLTSQIVLNRALHDRRERVLILPKSRPLTKVIFNNAIPIKLRVQFNSNSIEFTVHIISSFETHAQTLLHGNRAIK